MYYLKFSPRALLGIMIFLLLTFFLLNKKLITKRYFTGIVCVHAIVLLVATSFYSIQFGKYVFGLETKEEFLNTKVQTYKAIKWANQTLDKDSKILLTATREKFYFDFPVYTLDEYPLVLGENARKLKTIADIYGFLKRHEITHIFYAPRDVEAEINDLVSSLSKVCKEYGQLIYEENGATLIGVRHPFKKPKIGRLEVYELL